MEQKLDTTHLRPGIVGGATAIGVAATGIGMGILLSTWGISFLWQYTPPEIALKNPEVRIVQEEPFKVEQNRPFVIEQDKPLSVEQDKPFIIEQDKAFVVQQTPPLIGRRDTPEKTPSGDVIKREVTVFSEVEHGPGSVFTGWRYRNGSGGIPSRQYCYYAAPNGDGSSKRIDIASDGTRLPIMTVSFVPNLEKAVAKCQWWSR